MSSKPVQVEAATVLEGDCRELMAGMPESSVDAIVCDPPYALITDVARTMQHKAGSVDPRSGRERSNSHRSTGGFMGKEWDATLPGVEYWVEALRVAKPGAHLVAFGGTRTHHRLACAIEDAGWEIRDTLCWLYGSGFPKSLDVSKAMDRAAGAEREATGIRRYADGTSGHWGVSDKYAQDAHTKSLTVGTPKLETAPATDAARRWQGWGTALKPAYEPIILARKPLIGTVSANVEAHGTGALNIDATRIGTNEADNYGRSAANAHGTINAHSGFEGKSFAIRERDGEYSNPAGRWPANLILDETAAAMLDAQSGNRPASHDQAPTHSSNAAFGGGRNNGTGFSDSGGASRFFYCAKASRSEREEGLDGMPQQPSYMVENGSKTSGANGKRYERHTVNANHHPTVKPVALMRWLVRLVTPPGGLVLDPFAGSGSTGVAALKEGFKFMGIEQDAEYAAIARARLEVAVEPLLAMTGA